MPVTPFHGGAGLLAKGLLGRRVSFTAFCVSQVVIDVESGYHLVRGDWPVHTFLHTLFGATLACSAVAFAGLWLGRRLSPAPEDTSSLLGWVKADVKALSSLPTAVATLVLATLGHVVPDAIMHADVRPFAPIAEENPLLGRISLADLHWGLVFAGVVGALLVLRGAVTKEGK